MQRRNQLIPFAIGVSLVFCALAGAAARSGGETIGRVAVGPGELLERATTEFDPGPLAGIRSAGKAAMRLERSRTADTAPAAADDSPDAAVRGVALAVRISGVPMAGSVTAFAVDPSGGTAVYIADQDTAGRFELYSTPLDGSAAPTAISAGLVFGNGDVGVSDFQIAPDGSTVVFLADANAGGGIDDIYSVPIDGSAAPLQLNAGAEAPISAIGISPAGSFVAFFGIDSAFGSAAVELYSASIGVAGSATQLSDAGSVNTAGNVFSADFSPDGATMIYAADGTTVDDLFQWFSVPVAAAGPGADVQLSSSLGSVGAAAVTPDSVTVVYIGEDSSIGVRDVIAVPIGGGAGTRLNPAMAGAGASAIRIGSDGNRVCYLADQDSAGVVEVYSALTAVADSGGRLNTPMAGSQLADTLNVSPDSTIVLYEADQDTAGTFELYAVPIDGGGGPSTLHGLTPPDNVGFFVGVGTPVIGSRAVYPVFGAAVELFSVPFDGSESFTRINDTLDSGDAVLNAYLPVGATRLVAFGVGSDTGVATERVFAASIRHDLPAEQLNVTAGSGAQGVLGYEIGSGEDYAVYLQDQDTAGKPELFSAVLDSDGDAVPNPADNCPFVANPGQADVLFGQTVRATSRIEFGWNDPTEIRYVRGPLDQVDVLATDRSGTLSDTTSYADSSLPGSGSGFYYLFAADCAGRSYQTAPGAEPARDLAAFP